MQFSEYHRHDWRWYFVDNSVELFTNNSESGTIRTITLYGEGIRE